jgi:hypothetical protein
LQERVPEAKPYLPAFKRSIWYIPAKVARRERKYLTAILYLLMSLRYGIDRQNAREIVLFPYYTFRELAVMVLK